MVANTRPDPRTVYENILAELAQGQLTVLEHQIFKALRQAYPSALTRRQLIGICFGEENEPGEDEDLNNNKLDRKIRAAKASLFSDHGIPVVSSSGEAGYRLDLSVSTLRQMAAELEAKAQTTQDMARKANQIATKIIQVGRDMLPAGVPARQAEAKQLSLMEER